MCASLRFRVRERPKDIFNNHQRDVKNYTDQVLNFLLHRHESQGIWSVILVSLLMLRVNLTEQDVFLIAVGK